jgi:ubiquinone biosynthesis UbiH/UbiF/VisC/COQ6 family hydroxylase
VDHDQNHDLIVVGGGLVGSALGLAVAAAGLRVAVVEPQPPAPVVAGAADWDPRVYALSPGSRAWLESLGAWASVPEARIGVIDAMQVHGDDPSARLDFDSYTDGLPALAYTVEHRALQAALWGCVQARAADTETAGSFAVYAGAMPVALTLDTATAELQLNDGRRLRAALVVGADGLQSWTRTAAGLTATVEPYGQQALLADFATARPHRGVARQWFRPDGVLALLPMPGDRVSAVWSIADAEAARLVTLAPAAFAEAVREAAHDALGELAPLAPVQAPRAVPLSLVRVPRLVAPRIALVGDAAHGVHPLAGQGVNLGFRDAQALAAVLADREPGRDPGDLPLLRRYERARREDVWATQFVTDGLARLFATDHAVLARLRNAALAAVNRVAPLKRLFSARAAA